MQRLTQHVVVFFFASLWLAPFAQAQTTGFTDVSVARSICGLTNDQGVVCATRIIETRFKPPASLPPATAIAIGEAFGCALLADGNISCWGDDVFGILDAPGTGAPYQAVSAGEVHACAINRDNGLECWGADGNGRLDAPAGEFQQVSSSFSANCAVSMTGEVACWGANEGGAHDIPADLPPARQVASARYATCAILEDGSLSCWGQNFPTPPTAGPYQDLDLDYTYSRGRATLCLTDSDGALSCSFFDADRQASLIDFENSTPTGAGYTNVAVRSDLACAVNADGLIDCWGDTDRPFEVTTPPGLVDVPNATPATTGLRAAVYSDSTAELIWDQPSRPYLAAGHEIVRNGEVYAFTPNLGSYIVDDLQPGVPETFQVQQVGVNGIVGPVSDAIVVETGNNPGGGGGDGYQAPPRPFEPTGLVASVYSINVLELSWDRPAQDFNVEGYEIRRNGDLIGFTRGTSYLDTVPETDRVYRYDVLAIQNGGSRDILGFSSIDVAVGEADASMCR